MSSGIGYCYSCGFVLVYRGKCVKCNRDAVVLTEFPDFMLRDENVARILRLAEWKIMIKVTP